MPMKKREAKAANKKEGKVQKNLITDLNKTIKTKCAKNHPNEI